jgi:pyridoxine/pyridoxamine 5'-phosphate oxidase
MKSDSDIHSLRVDYKHEPLTKDSLEPDPIAQFRQWFDEARASGIPEPNAMTLGTADKCGRV